MAETDCRLQDSSFGFQDFYQLNLPLFEKGRYQRYVCISLQCLFRSEDVPLQPDKVLSGREKQSNQEIWMMRLAAHLRPILPISWVFENCFNDRGSPLLDPWKWFLLCYPEVPACTEWTSRYHVSAINGLWSPKKREHPFTCAVLTFGGLGGFRDCSLLGTVNIHRGKKWEIYFLMESSGLMAITYKKKMQLFVQSRKNNLKKSILYHQV